VRTLWRNRARRNAYCLGAACALVLALTLQAPETQWLQAAGRATPGHERLDCDACHVPAPGTLRQQLQANARYLLGLREEPAVIGMAPVSDAACADCHERPTERHPLAVLSETRFAAAQDAQGVQHCTGCHREHHGVRVTADPKVCRHCHTDTEVRDDPIVPSHAALFEAGDWQTCLQCHDFHGNHTMRRGDHAFPVDTEDAVPLSVVREYLGRGPRAYGPPVHPAKDND